MTVASRREAAFGDHDILGLQLIAGIAGGFIAKAELLVVLERTAARYRTLVDHLPGTAGMVFDQHLRLLMVAGPGAELWRSTERNVEPGHFLHDIVTSEELEVLEPFYQTALIAPATLARVVQQHGHVHRQRDLEQSQASRDARPHRRAHPQHDPDRHQHDHGNRVLTPRYRRHRPVDAAQALATGQNCCNHDLTHRSHNMPTNEAGIDRLVDGQRATGHQPCHSTK